MRSLSIALGEYAHAGALLGGEVSLNGYVLQPVEINPIIGAYRRMIRDLAFDICELAPTSYLMAREAGLPLTAIPVFLNRRFHHGDIQCAPDSGIKNPGDLEYRRVGVRAYSVTTGVWVRGLLAQEYGVDCSTITWVVDDENHIQGRPLDAGIEVVDTGRSLVELLAAGEIDATLTGNAGTGRAGPPQAGWLNVGVTATGDSDGPYPLFADADVLARDWYLRTGIYPLHSVIVMKQELVQDDPNLPTVLFAAFAESKRRQVAADPQWTALPRLGRQANLVEGDPIPYGLEVNALSAEALVRFTRDQGLIDFSLELVELLAPGDYADS